MRDFVTSKEIQEVFLVPIRKSFMKGSSPGVDDWHMHEDETGLCCLALLQLFLQPLAFCLIKA